MNASDSTTKPTTDDLTLKYYLVLNRLPRFGSQSLNKLSQYYSNISDLFRESSSALRARGLFQDQIELITSPPWHEIEKELKWAQGVNQTILTCHDQAYPSLLKEISSMPLVIYVKGRVNLIYEPQIAMVGSRNPTVNGFELAKSFARELSKSGFVITSGMALGIDGASHWSALEAGGATIAVLGTGVDVIYPKRHRQLACEIADKGALVSEFFLGSEPKATHFPRRNRIISGLSQGVLVVEAALRSGSLITARYANEQGREVFAIPGSIHNPMSRGCHYLLRQGAKIVETLEDIVEEISPKLRQKEVKKAKEVEDFEYSEHRDNAIRPKESKRGVEKLEVSPQKPHLRHKPHGKVVLPLDHDQRKLVECVGFETVSMDKIIASSGLSAERVGALLLEMELDGIIDTVPGGYVVRMDMRDIPKRV